MRYALPIASGVNVVPLHNAILRNQTLWNRQTLPGFPGGVRNIGPHEGVDDIWVRYKDWNEIIAKPHEWNMPHESVWYPAYHDLRCIDDIIFPLMAAVKADRLGAVLITRIPPGREVKWHTDNDWHANYYDKYAVQVAGNAKQAWHCRDGSLVTKPGDVYWFNNQAEHRVTNDSDEDRITMIVCLHHSKS